MAEKVATRVAYGKALAELGETYPNLVVLDADLSGSTNSARFGAKFPDRFFNIGIAEANMVGIAAGLAASGKQVFASTFAIFASGRAWEQIRSSVAFPNLNVKIAGSHGGLSVGEDGPTHQACEDLAIMRDIPGMMVVCPCDAYEMRAAVEQLLNYQGPAYLRLGRSAVETVTDRIPGYSFLLGKGCTLRDGKDVTIVAVGLMVQESLKAAELLAAEGIDARVVNMPTIKPIDEELLLKCAAETGCIVTCEEHSIVGGLGSAVCEVLSENLPTPVVRHGVGDVFGTSGKAQAVLDLFHLNPEGIADAARRAIAKKR